MGTNFYMITKSKTVAKNYAEYTYELIDEPYFGYSLHVAKTSMGWLPLFQAHENLKTIKDYKAAYDSGEFEIYDEYGTKYSWEEFDERVLQFNGGTKANRKLERIELTKEEKMSPFYDKNIPEYAPISHFEYGNGMYANDYYTDPDGYEFDIREFS